MYNKLQMFSKINNFFLFLSKNTLNYYWLYTHVIHQTKYKFSHLMSIKYLFLRYFKFYQNINILQNINWILFYQHNRFKHIKHPIYKFILNFKPNNRLFLNLQYNDEYDKDLEELETKNLTFVSPGMFLKYFEKKKSLKRTKMIKLLTIKYFKKLFLTLKIKQIFLILKKNPIFFFDIVYLLKQPMALWIKKRKDAKLKTVLMKLDLNIAHLEFLNKQKPELQIIFKNLNNDGIDNSNNVTQVSNDQTTTDVVNDQTTTDVVNDQTTTDVVNDQTTTDVVNDQTTTDVVNDQTTTDVVNDQTTTDVVNDQTTTDVVNDQTTTDVVNDQTTTDVVNDQTTTDVVNDQTTTDVVNDQTTTDIIRKTRNKFINKNIKKKEKEKILKKKKKVEYEFFKIKVHSPQIEYIFFLENKNYTTNKTKQKGRIKRKITKKIVKKNKIID
uniref:Uncharacterized protein n=1 Tax=Pseudourostyla cristata TaxID=293816 RepID=A0A4P9JLC3_9SPIT|nr:hypothetical protein [Pseudourostyla cristata]